MFTNLPITFCMTTTITTTSIIVQSSLIYSSHISLDGVRLKKSGSKV